MRGSFSCMWFLSCVFCMRLRLFAFFAWLFLFICLPMFAFITLVAFIAL